MGKRSLWNEMSFLRFKRQLEKEHPDRQYEFCPLCKKVLRKENLEWHLEYHTLTKQILNGKHPELWDDYLLWCYAHINISWWLRRLNERNRTL